MNHRVVFAPLAAVLLALAALPPVARAAAAPATIGIDEIRVGQRGYGLSAFGPGPPRRFDVEVVGVMRNQSPDISYILARLSGDGLETSGVAAGMSGSPVYLDGRLAGAVSFGWPFQKEPVCGITPIGYMRHVDAQGAPAAAASAAGYAAAEPAAGRGRTAAGLAVGRGVAGLAGGRGAAGGAAGLALAAAGPAPLPESAGLSRPPVALRDIVAGRVPADLLAHQLGALLRGGGVHDAPLGALASLEWSTSGFGERSRALLGQAIGNLATLSPGGRSAALAAPAGAAAAPTPALGTPAAASGGPVPAGAGSAFAASAPAPAAAGAGAPAAAPAAAAPDLVPGGPVAAVLVDGDLQLAAVGTVTDRFDDHVLAFGHAFLGMGAIAVPMATAEVITVISRQDTSFKVANVGVTVGAFVQDRQAAIAGRFGAAAPMVPLTVHVHGAGGAGRDFHLRLADIAELMPTLLGSSLVASLESASYTTGPQSLDAVMRFRFAGHAELVMRQSFDGESAVTALGGQLVAVASYFTLNPLERVHIEDIDVSVEQAPEAREATLIAAYADRVIVHPGESVAVHVELQGYRGDRYRRSFEIRVPADVPLGRYSLLVGDGVSADAARLTLAPVDPPTLDQALALLRTLHSRRDLALLGFSPATGLAVAGESLPLLPGSLRSLWAAANAPGAAVLHAAILQERHETLAVPLDGLQRIDLDVRRPDGSGGSDGGDGAPPAEATDAESGGAAAAAVTEGGLPALSRWDLQEESR